MKDITREQTRKDFVQSFWELYQHKDLSEITVKDIAQRAGYYRTTFYSHFKSVDDVLHYIHNLMLPENHDLGMMTLEEAMDMHVDKFIETADYLVPLSLAGTNSRFYQMHLQALKEASQNFISEDRGLSGIIYDLVFEYNYAGSFACMIRWYNEYREQIPVEQLKKTINTIYTQGFKNLFLGKTA